ncbi:MAG: hypothetical protein ABIH28_02025 [archaeon]
MKFKKIWKEIPVLPTTALIFYLFVVLLWNLNLIPPPIEVVNFLENLYNQYGLFGLAIASFLEGIVYLGLYFPGSFIIALAVFFSDGSFISLLSISLVVAITLTITAFINYFLGRHVSFKENHKHHLKKYNKSNKGLFASMLHPNILAFYFFSAGIEKKSLWKIIFVPIVMIPYGLAFAYLLYTFSNFAKQQIESEWFLFALILLWLVIAFILDHKRKIQRELKEVI